MHCAACGGRGEIWSFLYDESRPCQTCSKWIGLVGTTHKLRLYLTSVWHAGGRRGSWVRAETPEGKRVGWWTRSRRAVPGATAEGEWTVQERCEHYTKLYRPRGVKWTTT